MSDLNHALEAVPRYGDPLCVRAVTQVLQALDGRGGVRQCQVGGQLGRVEGRQDLDEQPPGDEQDPRSGYNNFMALR